MRPVVKHPAAWLLPVLVLIALLCAGTVPASAADDEWVIVTSGEGMDTPETEEVISESDPADSREDTISGSNPVDSREEDSTEHMSEAGSSEVFTDVGQSELRDETAEERASEGEADLAEESVFGRFRSTEKRRILLAAFLTLILLRGVSILSLWRILKKAKVAGWHALVPGLREFDLFDKMWNRPEYVLLLYIPVVNIVVLAILRYKLAVAFDCGLLFTIGLIFLPPVFYPVLGFEKRDYLGPL